MKMWQRRDEWMQYAACAGVIDFIREPMVNTSDRIEAVCNSCKVRPECMEWAVDTEATGVWSAGVWLPDQETHMDQPSTHPHASNKAQLKHIYLDFLQRVSNERARRGEDV